MLLGAGMAVSCCSTPPTPLPSGPPPEYEPARAYDPGKNVDTLPGEEAPTPADPPAPPPPSATPAALTTDATAAAVAPSVTPPAPVPSTAPAPNPKPPATP